MNDKPQTPQEIIDQWNALHPIGTDVKITNGLSLGFDLDTVTKTKSMAMLFLKREPVVYIQCMRGFINLNKLTVL